MGGPEPGGARDERAYLSEMVVHHEEAIAAARQLRRSERPRLRRFGAGVMACQSAQVQQMKGWLARWYVGKPSRVDHEPMMRDLRGLSGEALDRTFLEDMVFHHMAAVMTVSLDQTG